MKSLVTTRTFWFNVLLVGLEFSALPEFVNILPANFLPYLLAAQGLGNIILRYVTVAPVGSILPK